MRSTRPAPPSSYPTSCPRPTPRRRLAALLLVLLATLSAESALSQTIGPATYAEYDLHHVENVAGSTIVFHESEPGADGAESLTVTDNITATWGVHDVRSSAYVLPSGSNQLRLLVEGEHTFELSGTNRFTDAWQSADSTILARAELVEEWSLSGVPGTMATIELYFQVRGSASGVIDFVGGSYQDLIYGFGAPARLEVTTSSPHSGGGVLNMDADIGGGYRAADLDAGESVDEFLMLSLDVDPRQPIPLEIRFEVEPDTELINGPELGSLNVTGFHTATFWDNAAELLGVVVRDEDGDPVPGAVIVADSGYDYLVDDEPPTPQLPDRVILSPVEVSDDDLGVYDINQVPYSQMIDQSGLFVPFTSGQTGWDVYFSTTDAIYADPSYQGNWQSTVSFTLPLQGYLEFDLGDVHPIDELALWNISLEDIRVLVAESDVAPWVEVGQYTLVDHTNFVGAYAVETLDLGGVHDARYVRIEVDSTYLIDPSFTYAIVGEVAVAALTPVPEPDGLAMLGSGLVGVALLAHRRRDARQR